MTKRVKSNKFNKIKNPYMLCLINKTHEVSVAGK